MKYLVLVVFAFLLASSIVMIVFSNPIPTRPHWDLHIGRYLSILISELCGLFCGAIVLVQNTPLRARWREVTWAVLVALVTSYGIGVVIWSLGFLRGILVSNPVSSSANPFPLLNPSLSLLGLTVLLLPEFIGTVVGTMIIRKRLKIQWSRALASMTVAMLVSVLINLLIIGLVIT